MHSNETHIGIWEIFVHGPIAQSSDEGSFKTTKVDSNYNASYTFIDFKVLSHFV